MLTAPAAATAAAVSTTTTTTPATVTAPAPGRPLFTGARVINGEGPTHQVGPVEGVGCRIGCLFVFHGDEGEAAWTAGGPVKHQVNFRDSPVLCEQVFEVVLGHVVGQVSDE